MEEKNVTVFDLSSHSNAVTCQAKRAEVSRMKPNVMYSSKVKERPSQQECVVTTGRDTTSFHLTH